MSQLMALQQSMLQAVLADEALPQTELRDDARADVPSRMAIYRHGYRARLRDALITEYPGLGLMAGRGLGALLESYVEAHPSGHYNIRWHGAGMAAFLAYGLPWNKKPALAEMARLDWAISTAFDAADENVLDVDDLAGVPAEAWASLRLHAAKHLQVLSTHHNIEAFRRASDRGDRRPRLRRYDRARHLLVWRQSLVVRYRPLAADELCVLTAAMKGESFAMLCELLAEQLGPSDAMARMAGLLQQWSGGGLIAGWSVD